ncbi:MAG TPA: ATP-binding protein [Terrimicrobiaceae bacterium]
MSGQIARTGFLFQDLYLLSRVLRAASDCLDSAWQVGQSNLVDLLDSLPLRFGLEASRPDSSASNVSALDWDVLVLAPRKFEFAEVKSGAVSKDDRKVFWRRLRRELSRNANAATILVPVLVVDPTKVEALNKWTELTQTAAAFSGSPPAQEPTGAVLTANQLLEEALWWMCSPDNSSDGSDPAADFTAACDALSRFELHCHEARQLELQVTQFLELLFSGGLTDTQQMLLLGWLSKRASSPNVDRRLFSICELLMEIGILQDAISLAPGTLKEWRVLWNEVPLGVQARTRVRLGEHGESVPPARVQPSAFDALTRGNDRALVILGHGGAGKSTLLAQAADAAVSRDNDVLHCGADDVRLEELEQLTKAVRFRAALSALRRPEAQLFLCIDGLDEAEAALRKRWAQLLVRVASLPNVRTLVSMRDEVWRRDGEVRKELEPWRVISLDIWPEPLVRELLTPTSFQTILPPAVIELLRTPILLDLFWRTFVEIEMPDVSRASRLQSRHNLLTAFWHERLLASPRYSAISDILSCINEVVSGAAANVGGFSETNLSAAGVQMLLSEGVLVREGRLQPRLRFRHPLLRDFALAQWCLQANDPFELSRRWNSIEGGLQRHGALRAVFEALSDPDASTDYPLLTLGNVVQAIVTSDCGLAHQVAHVLGTREPVPVLDPANWPSAVQTSLPPEFARDLLTAARLNENGAWSAPVENWPDDAQWFNEDYPTEVWRYADFLSGRARAKPSDPEFREQAHQAARKLRSISEASRFANEFAELDRWLMMQAMLCVIPTLPDEVTLAWVEREMAQSSWRTRSFLLAELIHLAPVDASRTAMIYRQAVGLTQHDGRPVIDESLWRGIMDHQAIEWSLAGENGRRSLLKEYPTAFLPVAVDLAEALWTLKHQDSGNPEYMISELLRELDPSCSDEVHQQRERERQLRLGDLIDDSPKWTYWQSVPNGEPNERCLKAVHECAQHCAKESSAVFESVVAILRSSRMASIHTILFDVLLENEGNRGVLGFLRESVLDSRLYYVSGTEYWIEQGLMAMWLTLTEGDRVRVFEQLRNLLAIEETRDDARHFLARLPLADLPDDLQGERPRDDDDSYHPRARPNRENFDFQTEWTPVQSNELETEIGKWPEVFDCEVLKSFARSTSFLSGQETSVEKLRASVANAIEEARGLLPALLLRSDLLQDPSRLWVWQGLTQMLACFRRSREVETDEPASDVVVRCIELALAVLRNIPTELPGSLPEGDLWTGYQDTGWSHALRLADEALTWQPVSNDQGFQSQFIEVIKAAFATEHPLVQLVCTITIRPWHWYRNAERRQLHDKLVWNVPKHASVLSWSLSRLQHSADVDRARIFRLLLNRSDLADAKQLAGRLGQYVGRGSMNVFLDGQRSAAAEVARESVNSPDVFPLLQDASNRSKFLRSLVFGMKEHAKLMSDHTELAVDYGDWTLRVWRILRAQRQKRNESEDIILLAMHWLERSEGQRDRTRLKPWWHCLQPLFAAVICEGGRPDCFTLLFNLRGGGYNDLTTPEELLGLIEAFVERIRTGALAETLDLDQRAPEGEGYHSWRECAKHAAEVIESLHSDGSLRTDMHRERAHRLLSTLAAEPVRASQAIAAMHRLQNE